MTTIVNTQIEGLTLKSRGKVRDIYDLGKELLIVVSDRISAFDVVLPTPIPRKGEVLTTMSRFWFERTKGIIKNHVSDTPLSNFVRDKAQLKDLSLRSMVVKKAKPLAVEAIVRGYLSGSGLKEYNSSGTVCKIKLPPGLKESSKLPEPIFTPSTKADIGLHDENVSFAKMIDIVGKELSEKVRDASLKIYSECAAYALTRGIIIADTKFEFGSHDGELIVIDEMLTPDSSRFWPANGYKDGVAQPSFDKQYVRDWLISTGWDKTPPAPELPPGVVAKTSEKYLEALRLITL